MATRLEYVGKFKTLSEALLFEDRVLDSGLTHLPSCAKDVMEGQEPTSEYWDFLIGQLESSEDSLMFLTVA